MEIKVIRALFETNSIQRAVVMPSTNNPKNWILKFEKDDGEDIFLSLSRKKETKIFIHLISAIDEAKNIGFDRVEVLFNAEVTE